MDADDDLSIEAEIQRELDKLTEADLESSDNSILQSSASDTSQSEEVNTEAFPDEFDNYIKSIQQQTTAFELDLAECDDLLNQTVDISSSRHVSSIEKELEEVVAVEGGNIEEWRSKIIEDLENDADEESDLDDFEEVHSNTTEERIDNNEHQALVSVTELQVAFKDLLDGQKNRLEEQWKKQEDQMNQIIEKERHEEELFEQEIETKRQEIQQQFEREESRILTERKEREKEEETQKKIIEQQLKEETKKQQRKIEELEAMAKKEKEEYERKVREEEIKQEKKKENAAVTIQSLFKGYCTRKKYKAEVEQKVSEAKERWRQERIKQIEEEQRRFEEEEERQRKDAEEQARLAEERRLKEEKRMEEERKRKEEEEKRKQEEAERKQREKEEKIRLAEEKRKKAEEEKLRKEEEKKRKEEEKRRKQEEKKQKEEEERKRKEEEKLKKKEEEENRKREEAERKKREEEEKLRKQEEEKREKLEKEKLEKEEKKRLKEEEQKKEMERIRLEELKKLEELKQQSEFENQETELRRQEKNSQEFLLDVDRDDVRGSVGGVMNRNIIHHDRKSPRMTQKISGEVVPNKGMKNGTSLMEGLPSHLESKRLEWIKSCIPWSKVSNEPWKLKASTGKRPPRRPSSAKKLPLLEENIVLAAAKVASLRQVTTVELKDLPGSNISTLGQCAGLQCLKMTNCNLISIEGLHQCKQLKYLNLKTNKIEYIDLKGLGNIKFLDLSDNMISVIHGIDSCTDVRWLDLSSNKITRLGGLNGLRRLHTLNLARNQLISTASLGDTPTVQQLDLSQNHLQDVVEIDKLCLLQHLNVSSNNLLQIPDLRNHVLLQEVELGDNSITTLDEFSQCWLPLIQKLNVSQNSLEDLVSLENLLLLREFDLSNNQVIDLDVFQSSIQNCIYLEVLKLSGNPAIESIEDISSFRNKLMTTFLRLHILDGMTVASTQYGSPVKPRNSYEAMCLHQVQMMKDLAHRFQQDLKLHSDSPDLHVMCDIYFKFCDKTQKLAEEYRYSHEYGEVSITVPTAPTTPKSGRPRSSRANKVTQDSYMSPKEMFEKALQSEGSKSGSNGLIRGDNVAVVKPVVTAKIVQDILEDDPVSQKKYKRRCEAAVIIQSSWKGYTTRKWYTQTLRDRTFDLAVLKELNTAATKIQATWRGYFLRCRLEQALEFAKFEDDEDLGEVDLGDFNFNEDILDDWKPPPTPHLPSSHPVLGKPPSGKKSTPPKIPSLPLGENPHPPNQPKKAWRGMDSPLSDIMQNHPRPPSSLVSGTDTHRTVQSKKEEKISEEWGFKDNQTAHLMLQRAKKMKYNAERRKKISKLDPKQRLVLFRKLEETSHYQHVQPPNRKILPRKEYFQERQKEIELADREKRIENNEKASRTFEWVHTQVGDFDISDSSINANNHGNRMRQRYGSDGNLPKLDMDLVSGKPVRLVGSPVDLQSVDSASIQGEFSKPRRFSAGSNGSQTKLPPIKGGSAPIGQKRERISWRNPQNKNTDIGWGGGRKRVAH